MLGINTKTGFKIGGAVAIIILLLGITVVFGIYQMSKVNQEIIQISEQSIPLNELISEVTTHQTNQVIGQMIIVIIVGSIAATLVFFISQINKDLKKEVDTKTVELKKANEKLQELDKMKDEFIGIASHELKSPIQPIFGFAELAKSGDIDQKEAWDGVVELANKLQDLANAVLDVSRIESNRLKLSIEKIPINDEILDIIKTEKINLKGVSIEENLDENIEIEMDQMRFGQVLRNLLHNSIKFTHEGKIRIKTQVIEDENLVRVTVSDSGIGISEEILPRIFEKFVTKGKNQENQIGTGLGLFLCKGIILAHGGEITARNNPDKGATFEFTLPILQSKLTEKVPKFLQNKKGHM